MHKVVFAIVAACLTVPAIAAADSPTTDASKPAKPEKEKKICKKVQGSDSRIPSFECKTAEQWAADPSVKGRRSTISGGVEGQ
jgi:hypothetical protein